MLQPPDIAEASRYERPLDPIAPLRAALASQYEIEREIGQGAFATVYLAHDLKHERKVAIKVLNADPTSETGELRFIREIRLLARLQHPNILPLHDSGHVEALLYYVMPYVSGETLRNRIDREKQLPVDAACTLARGIADALAYAHAQGIIHRDIKPENILISAGHPILADFGIARAIDLAGIRQLTRTGMGSPGTPAYMSPEQLMGDKEIDARSDTYSLGCVLFEMLTGKPPFAGKEGFVRRFTEPPPLPSGLRKGIPQILDEVTVRTLARNPNMRFQTASELADALSGASAMDGPRRGASKQTDPPLKPSTTTARSSAPEVAAPPAPSSTEPAVSGWLKRGRKLLFESGRSRVVIAAAALIISAVIIDAIGSSHWIGSFARNSPLDNTRIAVLPFLADSQPKVGVVSRSLHSALGRWDGLNLVPYEEVAAAVQSIGRAPRTPVEARELALKLGARWFVWCDLGGSADKATFQLFDGAAGRVSRAIRISRDSLNTPQLEAIATQLLKVADRPSTADGGDNSTNSYQAWIAYGKAQVSLTKWDLPAAEEHFREAIASDPNYPTPRIWLAQLLEWERKNQPNEWGDEVTQALRLNKSMSPRDLTVAQALAALSNESFPQACERYKALTKADSMDFVGWYGLGECEWKDATVVKSPGSPSGWRFRSSYYGAARSYMRALRIDPGGHAILPFSRLAMLLPTAPTQIRTGRTTDHKLFAAYSSLVNDTIAFIPYPVAEFSALKPAQLSTKQAALDKASDILLNFAQDWAAREPRSAPAFEALADILETRGQLSTSGPDGMSAMDAARNAQALNTTAERRTPLAMRIAWLSFKQGDFAASRALADSILSSAHPQTADEAKALIGLAALTGKIGRTAELARISGAFITSDLATPAPARDVAASFFAFAALGVCADTVLALEKKLDASIASFVPEAQQEQFEEAIKSRPLSMLVPCTNGISALRARSPGDRQLQIQTAYAKHDFPRTKKLLASAAEDARTQRAGDLSLDYTYQLAWVRAAIGDTAGAINQLDRVLGAMPSMSRLSLSEAGAAAAAGRAMALRAELAAARGDVATAVRWAQATSVLWATADPPLHRMVERMLALSRLKGHLADRASE